MSVRPASLVLPFAVACAGIALFSAMDAYMKGLAIALGAYNAMLWRVWVGAALGGSLFAALLMLRRARLPVRRGVRLHLLRGTLAPFMAVTFFWGIVRVPLAEGIALSFIAPLITLYLAAVMLGETIERHAVAASLLGLTGVGVILGGRLSAVEYDEQVLLGAGSILISAVLYAFNIILQRKQAQIASPSEIAFFQSFVSGVVLALVGLLVAAIAPLAARLTGFDVQLEMAMPGTPYWPDILISALLMMGALLLLSWAYARAEAQALVTVEYTAFIWAAIFGWMFFAEELTLTTLAGTALIVSGCLIATQRRAIPPAHVEAAALP